MSTKTYVVPATFYLNHLSRECGATDKIISRTQKRIVVELDRVGYFDLLSDADYYWYCRDEIAEPSLTNSAKRTMQILKADGAPND
jgi:hypothetical protein